MRWCRNSGMPRFLSTPSARRATSDAQEQPELHTDFYPRPPRGGRHGRKLKGEDFKKISIHALREEGDFGWTSLSQGPSIFLSTPSARRATACKPQCHHYASISIHALREEGDQRGRCPSASTTISIHALREEGDDRDVRAAHDGRRFLSTPSARRATDLVRSMPVPLRISIHALREEGDWRPLRLHPPHTHISIHALREEGDSVSWTIGRAAVKFLSTPSARRATKSLSPPPPLPNNFYPRPPRGGRRSDRTPPASSWRFLSTPSARRATAKTETKSLFSNKLYNILHEFRRALIYNGSKSYPNHAK